MLGSPISRSSSGRSPPPQGLRVSIAPTRRRLLAALLSVLVPNDGAGVASRSMTDARSERSADEIERVMRRLRTAERERRAAIAQLIKLGAVRSHVFVGDLGEQIAAGYYGVTLLPPFTPGHDLVDARGRRIDVKTLHATPERPRTIIGEPKRPCDVIFALRLAYDYTAVEALEIPIDLAETSIGANGKVSW